MGKVSDELQDQSSCDLAFTTSKSSSEASSNPFLCFPLNAPYS